MFTLFIQSHRKVIVMDTYFDCKSIHLLNIIDLKAVAAATHPWKLHWMVCSTFGILDCGYFHNRLWKICNVIEFWLNVDMARYRVVAFLKIKVYGSESCGKPNPSTTQRGIYIICWGIILLFVRLINCGYQHCIWTALCSGTHTYKERDR